MEILGLEIKRIKKKDIPRKVKNKGFTLDPDITDKGKDYLFGLKNSPFSMKKNQGYLHYDGIRVANDRVHFMWKGDVIMSQAILGGYDGCPTNTLNMTGISGKQKVSMP